MRVFNEPNMTGFKCPICGTSDNKPVVLVGIDGTQDGYNIQAVQYHLDCIELTQYSGQGGRRFIGMMVDPEGE